MLRSSPAQWGGAQRIRRWGDRLCAPRLGDVRPPRSWGPLLRSPAWLGQPGRAVGWGGPGAHPPPSRGQARGVGRQGGTSHRSRAQWGGARRVGRWGGALVRSLARQRPTRGRSRHVGRWEGRSCAPQLDGDDGNTSDKRGGAFFHSPDQWERTRRVGQLGGPLARSPTQRRWGEPIKQSLA